MRQLLLAGLCAIVLIMESSVVFCVEPEGTGNIETVVRQGQLEPISVGVLLPFTGQYAWVSRDVLPVVEMIAEQVNQQGGFCGRPLALVCKDTKGTTNAGVQAATGLFENEEIVAVIGPTSLCFPEIARVIRDYRVPMISPTAGTTELDRAGTHYFFRTVPSDVLGGCAIARAVTNSEQFMGRDGSFGSVALLVADLPAMLSFRDPIEAAMEELNCPLVATIEFKSGTAYRKETARAVVDLQPDLIILIATPEDSVSVMGAIEEAGYQGCWFLTQDQTTSEFLTLASGVLSECVYGLDEAVPASSAQHLDAFHKTLQSYSGTGPGPFEASAYDAANILFLGVMQSCLVEGVVTRQTVAKYIREVASEGSGKVLVTDYAMGRRALQEEQGINYDGLGGSMEFDSYGNIIAPYSIWQALNGGWEEVGIVSVDDIAGMRK